MALLNGRAGRLTAQNGGFRPVQEGIAEGPAAEAAAEAAEEPAAAGDERPPPIDSWLLNAFQPKTGTPAAAATPAASASEAPQVRCVWR